MGEYMKRSEYISREAALSEACHGCSIDFPCEPCEPQNCEIKARLEAIPAADVVELPCKIGDTVYFLQRCLDSYTFVNYGDVIAFHVYRSCITVEVNDHDAFNPFVTLDVSAFGKTVFLTREEAEAVLKGESKDV